MAKLFSQSGTLSGSAVTLDASTAFGDEYGAEVLVINRHATNAYTFIDTDGQSHSIPANRGIVLPVTFRAGSIDGTGPYDFYASTEAGFVERNFDTGVAAGSIDTAELADDAVETAKIADGAVTTAKLGDEAVTGEEVANVADAQLIVGQLSVLPFAIPGGADGFVTKTLGEKVEVLGFEGFLKAAGTAGSAIGVDDGTNPITDQVDVSASSDKDSFFGTEIDDAYNVIAAAGTLRVGWSSTGGDFPAATVMVKCIKRA